MNKSWILSKSTLKELIKNKAIYYTMIFGVILLFLGFTQEALVLEFESNAGESQDLSEILGLIFFHIFLYIWFLVAASICSNNFFEELVDGSAEMILPYMSKKSYLLSKFVGYTVSFFLLLAVTFLILFLLLNFTTNALNFKLLISSLMLIPNFLFLFSLLSIFNVFSKRKTAGILTYITYLFFTILNVVYVLSNFFGEGLAKALKYIIPSIARWQSEIVKFCFGFKMSDYWPYWFLNVVIYSFMMLFLAMRFSEKSEV